MLSTNAGGEAGVAAKEPGRTREAKKASQSEKHISLSREHPKESANAAIKSTSAFVQHQWHREERMVRTAVSVSCHHQGGMKQYS